MKTFLRFAVAAGVGVLAGASAASDPPGSDWPQFRGHWGDGTWVCEGLPRVLDDGALGLVWREAVGGGYSGVTATGGRVFTMDRPEGDAVDGHERVVCLDAATGDRVWEHSYPARYEGLDYGSGPRASVTVADGVAYTLGAVGHAFAFDAATGRIIWSKDGEGDLGAVRPTWGFAASPVVWKETVIYQLGLPGGGFVAFDRATGDERWRGSDDPAGYATPTIAESGGAARMIAWTPEHIRGMSPETGEVFWSVPYPVRYGVSIAKPVVHRGVALICGYWHGSRAIRLGEDGPADASVLWESVQEIRGLMAQPLVREGVAYLLDRSRGLTAFEVETGKTHWDDADLHKVTPEDRNPQATMVWVRESPDKPTDHALALNANGELLSLTLTPEGFTIHSRAQVSGKTWAHPAYVDGHIIVRTDSEIRCWKMGAAPAVPRDGG